MASKMKQFELAFYVDVAPDSMMRKVEILTDKGQRTEEGGQRAEGVDINLRRACPGGLMIELSSEGND